MLLDLTLRNRLLNFPPGAPGFKDRDARVYKHLPVDAKLDRVWQRLVADEKPVKVHHAPDGPDAASSTEAHTARGDLCARLDDEHLAKRLQKLAREQATLESSTGDSAFFLAVGFLEWSEAPPKVSRPLYAPLLMVHVRLAKVGPAAAGGRRGFALEADTDEHTGNPCLREKLRAEHDIVLPPAEEAEAPDAYLDKVEAAVRSKKGWRVHRTAALGFFNFARYRLWLDLDGAQWPAGQAPHEHPIVRDLVDQTWRGDSRPPPGDAEVAAHQQDRDLPLVLDADGTQYAALLAAQRGQSQVVIGPPGSGKSQTIANLIAVAVAEGKRVLFVAQKLAALRVVERRLGEVGLSAFCLPLHAEHGKPADVHRRLAAAGAQEPPRWGREGGTPAARLARDLNEVAARLSAPAVGGRPLGEAMQEACALSEQARAAWGPAWTAEVLEIAVPDGPPDPAWASDREACLREWFRLRGEAGTDWDGWRPTKLAKTDVARVEAAARAVRDAADDAARTLDGLPDGLAQLPLPELASVADRVARLGLPSSVVPSLLRYLWTAGPGSQPVRKLELVLADYHRQQARAAAALRDEGGDPATRGRLLLDAANALMERLGPRTPLAAAERSLQQMGEALDQAQDLLALASLHPGGVRAAAPSGAETWGAIRAFAGLRLTPAVVDRPPVHPALSRALAAQKGRLPAARTLASELARARELGRRVRDVLPEAPAWSDEERQRLSDALSEIEAVGLGGVAVRRLGEVLSTARDLTSATGQLEQVGGAPDTLLPLLAPSMTAAECRRLVEAAACWSPDALTPPGGVPPEVTSGLVGTMAEGRASAADVRSWAASLATAQDGFAAARRVIRVPLQGGQAALADVAKVARRAGAAGAGGATAGHLVEAAKLARSALAELDAAEKYLAQVARALGQPAATTIGDLRRIGALAGRIRTMPALPSTSILDQVASAADVARVRAAVQSAETAAAREQALGSRVALADLPGREELADIRRRFRAHQGRMLRWLRRDYRSARAAAAGFLNPPMPADADVVRLLEDAEACASAKAALDGDEDLRRLLGSRYAGAGTDWAGVTPALDWADGFYQAAGARGQAAISLSRLYALGQKVGAGLEASAVRLRRVDEGASRLARGPSWCLVGPGLSLAPDGEGVDDRCPVATLRQALAAAVALAEEAAAELRSLGCPPEATLGSVVAAADRLRSAAAAANGLSSLRDSVRLPLNRLVAGHVEAVGDWYAARAADGVPPAVLSRLAVDPRAAGAGIRCAVEAAKRWVLAAERLEANGAALASAADAPIAEIKLSLQRLTPAIEAILFAAPGPAAADMTAPDLRRTVAAVDELGYIGKAAAEWDEVLGEGAAHADPDLLRETIEWVTAAFDAGLNESLLSYCTEADPIARLAWCAGFAAACGKLSATVETLTRSGLADAGDRADERSLREWREQAVERHAALAAASELLLRAATSAELTIQDVTGAAAALAHASRLAQDLQPWAEDLGTDPTRLRPETLSTHRTWVGSASAASPALAAWLVQDDEPPARHAVVSRLAERLGTTHLAQAKLLSVMRSFGDVRGSGPAGVADEAVPVAALAARSRRLIDMAPRLAAWAAWLREDATADRFGLRTLVAAAAAADIAAEGAAVAFRAAVAARRAEAAWRADDRLVNFQGSEHDALRRRFAEADRSQLEKNRAEVARLVRERPFMTVESAGRPATPEMFAVLRHEENKKRRHLPVRQLVDRAGPAMQEFCPCWLMTPLAVAQHLPPGRIRFDLVVIDEASQLPPEDAWGAIARGGQVVVVGDPKQMPPSDFFASSAVEDEEERRDDEEEPSGAKLDSILDAAGNCLPQSWLRWHYRSRHQSLIAPANRFSYGDRLILFPSAHDRHPELGVRHTFVDGATATTGRVMNAKEAAAVVDRLIEIARAESRKPATERLSVGVATMNAAQKECVQELLDGRRAGDAAVDRALSALEENANEPLFVENLENIQGDERDVIVISYTYGPTTPGGTPAQRFGPLNMDGGERRFNVLITRAKCRMEVFASIRSDQILAEGKKPGVQHFHYFLRYAETGVLADPGQVTRRPTDSPFEEYVMAVLRADGYEVEPQVGVAGYFIDLAVRHPRDRDRFVLGIECDGASYHSSKAARDRDRLREQVLRERGWELYRIWSTDWFTANEAAKEDLLVTVARVCERACGRTGAWDRATPKG